VRVLVIPEDQENDQYIARPVLEALFGDLGLSARIDVLPEPRLRGADDALDKDLLNSIIDENPMIDLFVLLIDRDCNRAKNEERARERQKEHEGKLLACVARQELEVWLLALYLHELDVTFGALREHCDPKEQWAEPLLRSLDSDGPGRGRKRAMRALKGQWRSLRDRCDELGELQDAIADWDKARKHPG
jgi:hypothetical protein